MLLSLASVRLLFMSTAEESLAWIDSRGPDDWVAWVDLAHCNRSMQKILLWELFQTVQEAAFIAVTVLQVPIFASLPNLLKM
jgi:hypothetical protein